MQPRPAPSAPQEAPATGPATALAGEPPEAALHLTSDLVGAVEDLSDAEMALWETTLRARAGLSAANALADAESINQRNRRIAYLAAKGVTYRDIADEVDLQEQRVWQLVQTPVMQELIAAFGAEEIARAASVTSRLEEVAMKGVELISGRMETMKAEDLTKATLGLLDRAGHGPNKRVEMAVTKGLDRDTLSAIKSRARQLESEMIDVTPAPSSGPVPVPGPERSEGPRQSDSIAASFPAPAPNETGPASEPVPDPLPPLAPTPLGLPSPPAASAAVPTLPSADGGSALREAGAPVAGGEPGAGGGSDPDRVVRVHGCPWPPGRLFP